jgi:hypothetical protein
MTEEAGTGEGVVDCGYVDRNERLPGATTETMNEVSNVVFAYAGLTGKKDRKVGWRDPNDGLLDREDVMALADQLAS